MKHKVGDIVRIKSIYWYERNKDDDGCFRVDGVVFGKGEVRYCGKTAKITTVHSTYYDLDIDNGFYCWADYMFEDDFIPTRPIGSTFEHDGKIFKVVENELCSKCAFNDIDCGKISSIRGICSPVVRSDHKSVIFKQIDKKDMETKVELKKEDGMVTKITIPDDCDFEVKDKVIIVTPKKARTWDDLIGKPLANGSCYIRQEASEIINIGGNIIEGSKNVFASEKHAKYALAMAQISQLMPYYGSEITDEEWKDGDMDKYIIRKWENEINVDSFSSTYFFLAFHTEKQRDDFLKYNKQLVKDYLMIYQP